MNRTLINLNCFMLRGRPGVKEAHSCFLLSSSEMRQNLENVSGKQIFHDVL